MVGQRREPRVVDGFADRDLSLIGEYSEHPQYRVARVDVVGPAGVRPGSGGQVLYEDEAPGLAQPRGAVAPIVAVESPDAL